MYDVHIHLIHIMYIDIKWYNIYIESIVIITLTPYINHWCWVVALISAARVARVPNPGCDPAKDAGGSWVVPTKKREVLHFKTSVNRIYGGYITDISIDSIVRWFQTLEIQFLLYDVWYISAYFNYLGQNPQRPILQKAAPKEIET
jgi:hypothetical protein